jgi:serine/threonine protein kinase
MTPAVTLLGERYELLDVIGAGGFCEVWRARDRVLDRQVAVKLLDGKYARDPEALARFRAEAQNAGCLTHVNIARVYDFGEPGEDNLPFLVMELVEGPTLADVLAGGPLDPGRAMDILAQAAAGLQAAHAAGIVHRDIKPGNLLLGPGGIVKVADFGISHTVDSTPMTCTGIVIGSPGYVAPERASGARASQASDLYALGVVAYECLAGAPPFEGTGLEVALAHLNRPFPPLPPSIPAGIATLVARLTDKDPVNRPASAGVVAEHALALRDEPVPALSGPVSSGFSRAASTVRARAGSTRWRTSVAIAAAISGLGIFLAAGINDPSSAHLISRSASVNAQLGRASDAAVETVTVSRSLIGQPVSRVVSRLQHKGLAVHVIWRRASGHRPGRVLAVRPLGVHRVHTTVTVIAVRAPGHRHSVRRDPAGRTMDAPVRLHHPTGPHHPARPPKPPKPPKPNKPPKPHGPGPGKPPDHHGNGAGDGNSQS